MSDPGSRRVALAGAGGASPAEILLALLVLGVVAVVIALSLQRVG